MEKLFHLLMDKFHGLIKQTCSEAYFTHPVISTTAIVLCDWSPYSDDVSKSVSPVRPEVDDWYGVWALCVFGSIHLLLSLWMVVEHFVDNWPNFVIPRVYYWIM